MIEKVKWIVVPWKKLWRTIGFPTVNIVYKSNSLESWTYKIHWTIAWKHVEWIWVYFKERELFEGHFFDYDNDCYWKEVVITPYIKIRENKSFDSFDMLKKQIQQDKEWAKNSTHTVITFGTFDLFHEWHKHYLNTAKQYWDNLVTIIARDKTVKKVKSLTTTHTEKERLNSVVATWISTTVELWDNSDYYSCLKKRTPHVICLWYDQRSFDAWILWWYQEQWIQEPIIVRLDSFKPSTYKSSNFRK